MIPILDFVISWIIVKATAWIVIEKETKKANNKNKKKQKLSYCSGTRIHNHLVCKRTLNHLAKLAESIYARLKFLLWKTARMLSSYENNISYLTTSGI